MNKYLEKIAGRSLEHINKRIIQHNLLSKLFLPKALKSRGTLVEQIRRANKTRDAHQQLLHRYIERLPNE